MRVSKCHHGSSGGVTAGHSVGHSVGHMVGHRGLAVRARPRGQGGGGGDIWTLEPSLDYLYLFAPSSGAQCEEVKTGKI